MKKNDTDLNPLKSDEESRRNFLKTAGKLAVYTPPAMMILMHPNRSALAYNSIKPIRDSRFNNGGKNGNKFNGGKTIKHNGWKTGKHYGEKSDKHHGGNRGKHNG